MTRITVKEAARALHMTELTVRRLMDRGRLDIGYAVRPEGGQRTTYYIYQESLEQEIRRLGGELGRGGSSDEEKYSVGDTGADNRGVTGAGGDTQPNELA